MTTLRQLKAQWQPLPPELAEKMKLLVKGGGPVEALRVYELAVARYSRSEREFVRRFGHLTPTAVLSRLPSSRLLSPRAIRQRT